MAYDWSGWKKGDKGVIEVGFTYDGTHSSYAYLDIYGNEVVLGSKDEINSVTRIHPPLKVGDRVRHKQTLIEADVIGVDGIEVWVRWCPIRSRSVVVADTMELVR